MTEKISVIVPVYNMEKYLSRCLNSILKNTYPCLEIICINDGSSDKSEEILFEFQKKDSRIIVYSQKNRGISATRNKGLSLATGKYISFVDSDDLIHPQYFELLIKSLKENNADIAMCDYIQTKEYVELNIKYDNYQLSEKLYGIDLLQSHKKKSYVWGKLYDKDVIKNIDFQEDLKGTEDAVFNTKIICNQKDISIVCIKEKLYYYFEREQSLKSSLKTKEYLCLCKLYSEMTNGLENRKYIVALNMEIFKRALYARYVESLLKENKNDYQESKFYLKLVYGRLVKSKEISNRKKFLFFIFKVCPLAYRMFRILNDPTMLYFEKNCKENRKKRLV